MKAVYFPETLTWKERITKSTSDGDVILSAVTPINTYVIHFVEEFATLKCLEGIVSFEAQRFQTIDEAKSAAQRHYDFIFSIALERYSEFLIDVSVVVLIKPDDTHSNFAVRRGVNASVYRRESEPDRWMLMAGNCFFYKPARRFVLDISVDFDKGLDDVTFSSYQEAVNACENWAKVNL